jgi:hypothetical protein
MLPSILLVDMPFEARRRAAAAVIVAVAACFFMWFRRRAEDSCTVTYGPMAERDKQRMNNLRYIYESDDVHCVNLLRMKRPLFQLCDLFRSRELITDSIHASVKEQVAMFLHVVGHNERFRVVDLTFRRSAKTISRFFQKVLYAVGEPRNELIVPPATNVHPRILRSRRWYPYFKVGIHNLAYIGLID